MSSAEHFQGLLNTTIQRLQKLCSEWQQVLDEGDKKCPDDAICEVMSALGKTNLLLNSKLPQFRHLVEELSRGQYGHRPITPADLQGFWDLISIEIGDVDDKFTKLAERKAHNWAELAVVPPVETPRRPERARNGGDKVDAAAAASTGKNKNNFDHLRSAAKTRLALAKAKMQESMQNNKDNQNETKENGLNCTAACPTKDRDINRVSIC